jgi:hypothetical protein
MTAGELVKALLDVNKKAPEGTVEETEVMLRHPGSMSFVKAKLTLTYTSKRVNGTTKMEQIPIFLIEEAKDDDE